MSKKKGKSSKSQHRKAALQQRDSRLSVLIERVRQSPPWILALGAVVVVALIIGMIALIVSRNNSGSILYAGNVQTVTGNSQWTPKFQDVNGVTMALVPPGCFTMGTDNPAPKFADQAPTTHICFDRPFWIDKTDVSQAQFKQFGGVAATPPFASGDNLPVEQIAWYEARDFCLKRGARLPTEAEWEYAARGPDNLIYPWGNTWDATKAVFNAQGTAPVGSIPAGASWVGALDMAGEVWQWVSSFYKPYPYTANDGRENDNDTTSRRVMRGGSWDFQDSNFLHTAFRFYNYPKNGDRSIGFRCAHS